MFFIGPKNSSLVVFKWIAENFGWYVSTLLYIPSVCLGAYLIFLPVKIYYKKKADKSVPVFRVPVRTRPRPQSYLIPLGETWEQLLISLLERHRIRYELRDQGTELSLRAFEKTETGYRLAEAREVAFPNGALEIPVAQPMSHIVSFLFEMDSADDYNISSIVSNETWFADGIYHMTTYKENGVALVDVDGETDRREMVF